LFATPIAPFATAFATALDAYGPTGEHFPLCPDSRAHDQSRRAVLHFIQSSGMGGGHTVGFPFAIPVLPTMSPGVSGLRRAGLAGIHVDPRALNRRGDTLCVMRSWLVSH
jgi:hypothetical protein